jgi:DnaK suppressor protein
MKKARDTQEAGWAEVYRRGLLAKRAELRSHLGVKFDTSATLGRVAEEDQAQVSHEEFISLSLNILDYQQLRLINEALDRISAGDYGSCLACGEPIPAKRLRVVPWARYCVPCQEQEGLHPVAEPQGAEPYSAA